MICPASVRGCGNPPTVAAVSSAQRNAYQAPTPSATASPTAPRHRNPATIAPSTATRRAKTSSCGYVALLDPADPRRGKR